MRRVVRAGLESALAVLALVLAVVTALSPAWIETLSGAAPEAGTGETGWWLVVVFVALALGAALLARRDLGRLTRRARARIDPAPASE